MNKSMFYLRSFLLRFIFPFLYKIYSIKIALTKEEKEKIFKFRYQTYRVELNHYFLDENQIEKDMLFDEEDFSDNTLILYVGDIDNIIGTIRISVWDKNKFPKNVQKKYFLDDNSMAQFKKIGELRFFQIKKEYRTSLLGLALMLYFVKLGQEEKKFLADIFLCDCQPGLLKHYMNLGCFSYTDKVIFKEYGILQIPLAVIPYDYVYMRKAHSITYHLSKYCYNTYNKVLSPEQRPLFKNNTLSTLSLQLNQSQIDFYRSHFIKKDSVSNFNFIIENIRNVLVLSIESGAIVIKKDIQDYDCYLLLDGKLGIFIGNLQIAELQPGDIFGEMALLSERHRRFANVIALTDAKVLFISKNALYVLEKKSPKIAIQFLHILCKHILKKIHSSNSALYDNMKSKS